MRHSMQSIACTNFAVHAAALFFLVPDKRIASLQQYQRYQFLLSIPEILLRTRPITFSKDNASYLSGFSTNATTLVRFFVLRSCWRAPGSDMPRSWLTPSSEPQFSHILTHKSLAQISHRCLHWASRVACLGPFHLNLGSAEISCCFLGVIKYSTSYFSLPLPIRYWG